MMAPPPESKSRDASSPVSAKPGPSPHLCYQCGALAAHGYGAFRDRPGTWACAVHKADLEAAFAREASEKATVGAAPEQRQGSLL